MCSTKRLRCNGWPVKQKMFQNQFFVHNVEFQHLLLHTALKAVNTDTRPSLYTIMRLRHSVHFFLLGMVVGLSLSWLIYLGLASIWFGNHLTGNLGRTDVASVTPWLAPIVWEGTFDATLIDSIYKQQNITIATTVFALGKYTRFLKDFLESAEEHYFIGFRVHYYLFTDQPEAIPNVKLGQERYLTVKKIPSLNRWQDISMGRMDILEKLIENELAKEKVDYIFCLDVDTKFYGRWGVESLGHLVGVIHPWFFDVPRFIFTYEHRPESQAYIPAGVGDYYYTAAAFGGSLKDVHHLTKTCREQLNIDAANSIEAVWHEESHLNKYFLYNKPSKLLSPEYLWRDISMSVGQVKIIRFSHVAKNNAEVRPNL